MAVIDLMGMILITAALIFYSIGVWGEKIQGTLLKYHVIFFWVGLLCDTLGTTLMFFMAEGIVFDIHAITGAIAILLMFLHAVWATKTLRCGTEEDKQKFHKYSLVVWFFWLIPYLYPATQM
ncbi:MAG: TIGR03987 family protein [Candidatus Heimdallarchaeota archaeon]|nr:TIGR03987 family protein [Candidatus Heimdallarchaeota archaeon]